MNIDSNGNLWHIAGGAILGGLFGGVASIVGQAVAGQKINWVEVGVSAASGALTGAISAAVPGMGAVATGLVHGSVGSATYAATEKLAYGRDPSLEGILASGITSGVLAGGAKAIGNKIAASKSITDFGVGEPFIAGQPVGTIQIGVDPKTLTPNGRTLIPSRLETAERYGKDMVVEVFSNGVIYDGHHRVANAIRYGRSVDVLVRFK